MDKKNEKLPLFKEENGIRYILINNQYYVPDIIKPVGEMITGRYKEARARFLLNHRRDLFLQLQENGKILEHLEKIEEETRDMINTIMEQMLKAEPIPESLKNTDQLKWVGLMTNYEESAIEIVMHEVIYREGLLEEMEDMDFPEIDVEEVFRELTPEEEELLQ